MKPTAASHTFVHPSRERERNKRKKKRKRLALGKKESGHTRKTAKLNYQLPLDPNE